jgi:hypothetical protein
MTAQSCPKQALRAMTASELKKKKEKFLRLKNE